MTAAALAHLELGGVGQAAVRKGGEAGQRLARHRLPDVGADAE